MKLAKWARKRWGRGEQFHNIKKKFNRKRDNQKIDPEKVIEEQIEEQQE